MRSDVIEGVPARHWHALDDGRIQCDVCPRYCRLHDGQRGLCFVRARRGEELVLTTYGRSSGFCIDPIEKKPLNHFLPGTPVLSFGTAGCNLTCKFCQNWDISKARALDRLQDQASPEAIARAAADSGCRAVAYTYNDPVIFLEYAIDVAEACRARGIKNVAVSAGYMCAAPRAEFYAHMDAANIDLKAFTEGFYRKLCTGALQPVLDTLEYLRHETDVWLEITTLLIPGHNDAPARDRGAVRLGDGPSRAGRAAAFHGVPSRLQDAGRGAHAARHADPRARHRGETWAALRLHRQRARRGRPEHLLPCLRRKLIGRDWYRITAWQLTPEGACASCGAPCAGVFDARPGAWGQRRMPVWLGGLAPAI